MAYQVAMQTSGLVFEVVSYIDKNSSTSAAPGDSNNSSGDAAVNGNVYIEVGANDNDTRQIATQNN